MRLLAGATAIGLCSWMAAATAAAPVSGRHSIGLVLTFIAYAMHETEGAKDECPDGLNASNAEQWAAQYKTEEEQRAHKFHTARERLTAHRRDPVCAGCHKITDPIGLALEQFDGSGAFRLTEQGATIDAAGSLDGVSFADAKGLGEAVARNPATTSCLVRRFFEYGVGHVPEKGDRPTLSYLGGRFAQDGFKLRAFLADLVESQAFFAVSTEDGANATKVAAN